jgi:predicted GIY-YIG superfamily endonuclease
MSHKDKQNTATKEFSELKLIYTEKYKTRKEAEKRETQIKKWTRAKKEALVLGNIELLKKLSKS